MVAQPVFYYRFDVKGTSNINTGIYEKYLSFVDRYDMTEKTLYFSLLEDVDYKPGFFKVAVKKTFFANPTNDKNYEENEIDSNNAFNPSNNHVIVIGPTDELEDGEYISTQMLMGVVQTVSELSQDYVEIECWAPIRALADRQVGTDFHFNYNVDAGETDNVNDLQLYYHDSTFSQDTSEHYEDRVERSDPAFPYLDAASEEKYPYAVYSMIGTAIKDGQLTINVKETNGYITTFVRPFYTGDTAEYVLSSFAGISLLSGTELRMNIKNNSIVFQCTTYEGNVLTSLGTETEPFIISVEDSGFTTDYVYIGKASNDMGVPPEDGRVKITPMDERRTIPMEERPLFPMSVYDFETITLEIDNLEPPTTVEKKIRNIFHGYSASKIAWRLLQDVGWCREPFFDDMNPFCDDYTTTGPETVEAYESDGLYMDFPEVDYGDGDYRKYMPFFTSFDCAKQSYVYNLKTLADSQGLFIDSTFRPKIEDGLPVWDENAYNKPTSVLLTLGGGGGVKSSVISFTYPLVRNGSVTSVTTNISALSRKTTKEIMALLEEELINTPDFLDNYRIVRHGSQLYIETHDLSLADASKFSFSVGYGSYLTANIKKSIALTNTTDRENEKIYYMRRWGVLPGFHPQFRMRMSPTLMETPPTPEYELEYGGSDKRKDTTDVPAIVARPVWAKDSKDMINKVVVNYNNSLTGENRYMVFPSATKQYKYYVLKLAGLTTRASVANITLSIVDETGTTLTQTISRNIGENFTSMDIAAEFNSGTPEEKILIFSENKKYYISSNYGLIYISAQTFSSEPFILSTDQIKFTMENNSEITVDRIELVDNEPEIFKEARDSQAQYDVRELSLTLPEFVSINDTMTIVSRLFKKYMHPKDKCVCEVTQPSGWHIPIFSYVNLKDYTNFDTVNDYAPWYVRVLINGSSSIDQKLVFRFKYTDGQYQTEYIDIAAEDSPEDILHKIITEGTFGEFNNYNISVDGHYLLMLPKDDFTKRLQSLMVYGQWSDINSSVKVLGEIELSIATPKDKDLALLRIEADSKTGTYTCTFGQPIEDISNIMNQINTWVGDVEKTSSVTYESIKADFSTLVVANWLLVGIGGEKIVLNSMGGTISSTGDIYTRGKVVTDEGLETFGTIKADGNLVCHLSGTHGIPATVKTTGAVNAPGKLLTAQMNGVQYVIYSDTLTQLMYFADDEWKEGGIVADEFKDMDVFVTSGKIYVAGVGANGRYIKVFRFNPDGSIDTTFGGTTGMINTTVYADDTAQKVRIHVDTYVNIVYSTTSTWGGPSLTFRAFGMDGTMYDYSKFFSQFVLNGPKTIKSFDIARCLNRVRYKDPDMGIHPVVTDYLYVAVSYTNSSDESLVELIKKENVLHAAFIRDGFYDTLLTRNIDVIQLETYSKFTTGTGTYITNLLLFGVGADNKMYLSQAGTAFRLKWYKVNISDIKSILVDNTYGIDDAYFGYSNSTGYIIARTTAAPTKVQVYKFPCNDSLTDITDSNIELVFESSSFTSPPPKYPKIVGISNTAYSGVFYVNNVIYYTVTEEVAVGINFETVVLGNNDKIHDYGEYYYNGKVVIPYDGYYAISWQLKRSEGSSAAKASLVHSQVGSFYTLSSDYNNGYLKGSHSAVYLSKGNTIHIRVEDESMSNWNNLNEAYLNIYMVSRSD